MMRFILIPLLILFLQIGLIQGSNIKVGTQRVVRFIDKQGFFQNTINDITADEDGYLWIATPNGLVKYDGYTFEYYYHDIEKEHSIPNNFVKSLLNDSEGKLWIGTRQGLCVYRPSIEEFVRLESNVKNEAFIKEDGNKRLWIAVGSKLYIFGISGTLIREIDLDEELNQKRIRDLVFLSDDQIILSTYSDLYMMTVNEAGQYSIEIAELKFEDNITGITNLIKKENSIWIGTNNGIFQTYYENGVIIIIKTYLNVINTDDSIIGKVLSMFFDEDNNLWIGTDKNGLFIFNNDSADFVNYKFDPKNEDGISSNRINCFFEDAFDVMWIGTAQGGLNKLDKNQKPFYTYSHNPYNEKTLSSNLVTDIFEDKNDEIWVSFYENTICRSINAKSLDVSEPIQFERLERQFKKLKKKWVQKIYRDHKGYWWIGTDEELYLYDSGKDKLHRIKFKIGDKLIKPIVNRVITQIDQGQILIGSSHVLLLDDPWTAILNNKPVLVKKQMFSIGEDNNITDYKKDRFGYLWFATMNGVFRVGKEEEEWKVLNHFTTNFDENIVLSHNNIFSIYISENEDIWLGSFGGGLMKLQLNPSGDPESIRFFNRKHGLPDEAVYGILEDSKGNIWISTDMGICKYDTHQDKFETYDVNDGILNNNFRQSAYLKSESGVLFMGGLNGLTIFKPEDIHKNQIHPQVLISKLRINHESVIVGEELNDQVVLQNSISKIDTLTLSHKNRNISFDIIVQHSSTPNKNRVAYKLEGVNNNWIEEEGGKTTATYTNLRPGTYTFYYKGCNGDGVWTSETQKLYIKIWAPWYLRWWSIMFWCILCLCFIVLIFRYFVHLEKLKQKLKFEQMEKERIHELDQAKLRFFTNISHEFKTPLSLIIGPLEKIAEHHKRKENLKYFTIIQNNIARLQRLIEQLISYRKIETGYMTLDYSQTTLGNFIYPILEAYEESARISNLNFYHKVNDPNQLIVIDSEKTEIILLNLLSNAFKFTEVGGDIYVEVGFCKENGDESVCFKITDSGIGIPQEEMDKIFERFYRAVDEKGNWSGTGIGLALSKSLVDLMKGSISVESECGKGTVFNIFIPINRNKEAQFTDELSKQRKIVVDWIPSNLKAPEQVHASDLPVLLIVDDEPDVRAFLFEALKAQFDIILASDGEEAWNRLNDLSPQVVVSDVMMPKLNGYQLCDRIKSNQETCHIPVILLTALGDMDQEIEGLEQGADDYIRKPFSIKHLEVRIKKLLENKKRIIEYFSRNSTLPDENLSLELRDRNFLEKVINSIEKNMSDSAFGVEELAKDVGMSTSHFYRRLKELTGQAPNVYLRNYRLQKAAELFRTNKNLQASEVMFEIGIESPSYFSTSFKKFHGISPSEYTKKNG
ncbi:hybrid sensor histidine kinase/response regulator [Puteibacter caeruleilacunae]|nr:hybrid sensor histidine kinase/response regulator [Puteibacter caeruleilacunae]